MVKITDKPLSPGKAVDEAKTTDSGCVATYVGLIRDNSREKMVRSVEYRDIDGKAEVRLQAIADEVKTQFPVNSVVIYHRTGLLKVGDVNLVVAIGAAHRGEGLAAVARAVDLFKERLPTAKKEIYTDGTAFQGH